MIKIRASLVAAAAVAAVAACAAPSGRSPSPPAPTGRVASAVDAPPTAAAGHRMAVNLDPKRFTVTEHDEQHTLVVEQGRDRLLEFYRLTAQPCARTSVPKIGPITATDETESVPRGDLVAHWFTQRSSVDHSPFVASGFYVCSGDHVVVVRFVGPESAMEDAATTLRELLAQRQVVVE